MRTWEYLWITHRVGNDELNAHGANGWELVAVCFDTHSTVFYFKREVEKPS